MHLKLTWLNGSISTVQIGEGMLTFDCFHFAVQIAMVSHRALQRVELVWSDTGVTEREWNNPVA